MPFASWAPACRAIGRLVFVVLLIGIGGGRCSLLQANERNRTATSARRTGYQSNDSSLAASVFRLPRERRVPCRMAARNTKSANECSLALSVNVVPAAGTIQDVGTQRGWLS